jgi:hypothetical protein
MHRSRGLPLHHPTWHEFEAGLNQPVPANRNAQHSQHYQSTAHGTPTYLVPRMEPAQVTFHIGRTGTGTTATRQSKLYPNAILIGREISPPCSAWILTRNAIRHPSINSQKFCWTLLLMLAGGISSGIVVSHLLVLAASPVASTTTYATHGPFAKRTVDNAASGDASRMPMPVDELRKLMLDSEPDVTGSRTTLSHRAVPAAAEESSMPDGGRSHNTVPLATSAGLAQQIAAPAASAQLQTSRHSTAPRKAVAASTAPCSEPLQALGLCGMQPDRPPSAHDGKMP